MSDQNLAPETTELKTALEEVAGADALLNNSLLDDTDATISTTAVEAVTETEIEALRTRARRERARGVKNLQRRHEGVASLLAKVTLNERVTGSAFERWFAAIENGIYVLHKRGHMFVGEKSADALLASVTEKIQDLEKAAETDMAAVKARMEASSNENMFELTYAKPASSIEVQLRTPLSNRVLKVIKANDEVLSGLVKLQWNGEVEQAQIEDQENRTKRGLRELAKFLGRTMRGMRAKVTPKQASPAAGEAGAVATAANSPAVEDAA